MRPPYTLHRPAGKALPLVLDSPHSGEFYPDDFDHVPARAVVRLAEDTHVARLYRSAPALGATLIEANFPRAYIDANRSLADIDPDLLADAWDAPMSPGRKTAQGMGLVWRLAQDGSPMYRRKLAAAELRHRIERWYRPYHAALDAELDRCHREFGAVWLIDCHSMPAVGDERADDPGRERPDFVLGDRDGTTCAPRVHGLRRGDARRTGLRRRDQRSVQGRRDRPAPRAPRAEPAQPADRGQAHALHGRGDAAAERRLRAS